MCHSKEFREDKIEEAELVLKESEEKNDEANSGLVKKSKEDYRQG